MERLITPAVKLCTDIDILSPAFFIVLTANSCDEFLISTPSTADPDEDKKDENVSSGRWVVRQENLVAVEDEKNQFSLKGLTILPKILSPTFNKPHLSAELPAIMLFTKIPDTSESPDTLT